MFNKNRTKELENKLESLEELFMGLSKQVKHMDIQGKIFVDVLRRS